MSTFRSAPRKRHLNQVKPICGYFSKIRHSAIRIHTEEVDYSDISRTEYNWEFSVYRGSKEELTDDTPELLGKYGPVNIDGWKISIVTQRETRR
jgi:hypothetical protein